MEQLRKRYIYLKDLLTSLFDQNSLVLLLIGLILIGFGVLLFKTNILTQSDKVEVLNSVTENQEGNQEIVVEISGSVEKPGVYKMKVGDRVDDLLIISGGLSVNADRDWVVKKINRASKLIDGQKIYIYQLGEVSAKETEGVKVDQGVLGDSNGNLVNINTASQKELDSLSGIGPVYAQNIIEHRPYSTLEELVSKGAIGKSVFEKIKNSISL
ncbi:MAG: helix-hairpin-helix domain-containing protein [bacterium]|nr:MAG: helix-hairpin-helix domain-containing protein [bacterium]